MKAYRDEAEARLHGWDPEMADFAVTARVCLENWPKGFAYDYMMTRRKAFGISRDKAEAVWNVVIND